MTPEWLKSLITNFGKGMADTCNILYTAPIDYIDYLKKVGPVIGVTEVIKKGVVVGGYSQGGTFAIDAATIYQNSGVGSIVIVASTAFDNS